MPVAAACSGRTRNDARYFFDRKTPDDTRVVRDTTLLGIYVAGKMMYEVTEMRDSM